jgi:hypothetical protein
MSRKIDHKLWECPPHTFEHKPGTKLGKLSQDRRRKVFGLMDRLGDVVEFLHFTKVLSYDRTLLWLGRLD